MAETHKPEDAKTAKAATKILLEKTSRRFKKVQRINGGRPFFRAIRKTIGFVLSHHEIHPHENKYQNAVQAACQYMKAYLTNTQVFVTHGALCNCAHADLRDVMYPFKLDLFIEMAKSDISLDDYKLYLGVTKETQTRYHSIFSDSVHTSTGKLKLSAPLPPSVDARLIKLLNIYQAKIIAVPLREESSSSDEE